MSGHRTMGRYWFALCLLLLRVPVWAEPDDTQQAWLDRVGVHRSWDSIRGAPEWIDGPEPRRRPGASFYTVKLSSAEAITVRAPAGERILLHQSHGPLEPESLEVSWSNGSGLFAALAVQHVGNERGLLATPPKGTETLVRVKLKPDAPSPIELALFVSRDDNRLVATRYRENLTPLVPGPRVRLNDGNRSFDYRHTDREHPLRLTYEGAARIRIDSRLQFPPEDGPLVDSYRIYAYLDGEPWRVLDLATLLDTTAAIAVDGCIRPFGRPAYAYLDLPEGPRQLELRVRRPMLMRLLARQKPGDYLYQGNLPLGYPDTVGGTGSAGFRPYFWGRTEAELKAVQDRLSRPDSATYLDAVRIAQDNAYPLGGVAAVRSLSVWAKRYPAQEQYRAMAARRRLLHTFYRNLLPQRETDHDASVFAWFLTPHLESKHKPVFFAESYARSLAGNLANGYFTEIPSADKGAKEYLIPEHSQPHQLRIAVERSGLSSAQTFYVQMDDAEPVRLRLEPWSALSASEFRPTTGAIALALLAGRRHSATATLSGTFAAQRAPAPLADVGYLELPLHEPVRRLKVWREDSADRPPRVALAYRTSGWFQLSESGYLDLLDGAGSTAVHQLFQEALSRYTQKGAQSLRAVLVSKEVATSGQEDILGDLYNQWLPLLRFLHARHGSFSAGVEEQVSHSDTAVPRDPQQIDAIVREAEAAERRGDWQGALDQWSWIHRTAHGSEKRRARRQQIHALQQLGNQFLAQQLLRHDFLYSRQSAHRQLALEQLVGLAVGTGDLERVLTLRSVAAILDPTADNLKQLAAALAATGRSRFAMQVLLALPENQRPQDSVLETAYDMGWWRLFERVLAAVSNLELQALWRGYRAQLKGDYQRALAHWREAGRAGGDLSRHLIAGLEIGDGLDSEDGDVRRRAVLAWEEWQRSVPGPGVWRGIPQAIMAHGGTRSAFSVAQETVGEHFLASPQRPLTVSVYGPTSLRFEVRPLHDAVDNEPINDWISVGTGSRVSRHPVIDNRVSADLRLATDGDEYAGRKLDIPYQVPAGYHELKLSARQASLLVRVSAYQPRTPLTLLPPLTPYTVQSVLEHGLSTPMLPVDANNDESVQIQVLSQCTAQTAMALYPFAAVQPGVKQEAPIMAPNAERFRTLDVYRSQPASERSPLPAISSEMGSAQTTPSLRGQLIQLLWDAEQVPGRYPAALTQAEKLAQEGPYQAGTEPILRRLRRYASWRLVRSAQESAGVRLVDFIGWQPEAPELKTRKAIMDLHSDDEEVISGHDTRVLSMYNLNPMDIGLELNMQDTAYQPSETMPVLVAWDESPATEVLLSPRKPAAALVRRIDAGDHVLRIRIARPLANQFLRIRVTELHGASRVAISDPVKRSYMIATPDQPVVLLVQGPTRLRIDEWRDGRTLTAYRTVEPGWQQVVIRVVPGREEALLRVFQRTLEFDKPTVSIRDLDYSAVAVAGPIWSPDGALPIADPEISEPLANRWLADGTWSLVSGLAMRRHVDEEPLTLAEEERYLTLGGAYRYFSDQQDTYYRADGEVRVREHGDPTLATRGSVSLRKLHWPLDLDVSGSLFLQHVDATGRTEAAATVRARIARTLPLGEKASHRLSLSLFHRWLSLDAIPDTDPEAVDQDIFTRYKRDHKQGLRIGDRFHYRPWLDTVLYAGIYLVSNEDLNILDPDHLGVNIGARQLIGDVALGVNYRNLEYFEDDDRLEASNTRRLRFDLGFSRWFDPRYGLQAGLRYEYDQDTADSSVFLTLSLDRSNGRFYRDFKPGDLNFRWLRQRRLLEQQTAHEMK